MTTTTETKTKRAGYYVTSQEHADKLAALLEDHSFQCTGRSNYTASYRFGKGQVHFHRVGQQVLISSDAADAPLLRMLEHAITAINTEHPRAIRFDDRMTLDSAQQAAQGQHKLQAIYKQIEDANFDDAALLVLSKNIETLAQAHAARPDRKQRRK